MSWAAFRRRSAQWGLLLSCGAILAAPLPAAAFAFADGAEGSPCTLAAWSFVTTGPVAGGPYDPSPVVRYAGRCAMRTAGGGSVRSDHPASESTYRARFYVFPQTSAGAVVLFQARDVSGFPQFSIAHDPAVDAFLVYVGSASSGTPEASIPGAPEFRWYSVEVYYRSAQRLGVTVQRASASTPLSNILTNASTPASTIDSALLGWLGTANGNPTGAINFDAFESNNPATPIGALCRGNVDGDIDVDATDYKILTDELLRRDIAAGQPDCTGDGKLDAFDRVCVAKLAGACP